MRAFSELFGELDTTTATSLNVAAMVRYFKTAPPGDAAWAAYILLHVWLVNGATRKAAGAPGKPIASWVFQGIGDFSGDHKADILVLRAQRFPARAGKLS